MQLLYVHGMGRSPLSGWPMLRHLRKAGFATSVFGYVAALEPFDAIVRRLRTRIEHIARQGPYVVAGHSLGGVLLRAALTSMPSGTLQPQHVFLIGSPMSSSRLAVKLKARVAFKLLTGDCGQLLASPERMSTVAPLSIPTTAIVGIAGPRGRLSPFGEEPNDGVVSDSEVSASWVHNKVELQHLHTFLPASASVANVIIQSCSVKAQARRQR